MAIEDQLVKLSKGDRELLEKYQRNLELRQLSNVTVQTKLWKIYTFIKAMGYKKLSTIKRDDLESYVLERRKKVSPYTLDGDILELRLFFDWYKPGHKLFDEIKFKPPKNNLPVDQIITPEDVRNLLAECTAQRDRAIVMLLWDSACRLDEMIKLQIGHVQFDQYGAVIIVNGKTGMRRLRLVDSVPDLQAWINIHPMKNQSDAPLFVTTRKYNGKFEPLHRNTVQNTLKRLAKNSGITKWSSPHALRHGRLTDLARQGFNETELRIIAGWEKDSNMPSVYIHLGGGDVERKILVKSKLIKETEEIAKSNSTSPIECPRCNKKNPPDAKYCISCSFVLDIRTAKDIEEKSKFVPVAFTKLQQDPEFQRLLTKMLDEMDKDKQ